MCADADCRKRDRSVPSRRCNISRILARKTASLVTTGSELSARALTLRSVLAAISVLDFARVNNAECTEIRRIKGLTTQVGPYYIRSTTDRIPPQVEY